MSWFLNKILVLYKVILSPFLGGRCRFYPSCSEYAEAALKKHRWDSAVFLVGRRLLRCHPFSQGGVDLVP
jgi:putative membrane protein insertion efficiency factor